MKSVKPWAEDYCVSCPECNNSIWVGSSLDEIDYTESHMCPSCRKEFMVVKP
jgi:uncharacterized protein with PIN domain